MLPGKETRESDRNKQNTVAHRAVVLGIDIGRLKEPHTKGGCQQCIIRDGGTTPNLRIGAIEFKHFPFRGITLRLLFVRNWEERAVKIRMRPCDSSGHHRMRSQRQEMQRFTAGNLELQAKLQRV